MRKGTQVLLLVLVYVVGAWTAARLGWVAEDASGFDALRARFAPAPATPSSALRDRTAASLPTRAADPAVVLPRAASSTTTTTSASAAAAVPPPGSWDAWRAKLRARRAGAPGRVRVLQLGDSELIADGPSREVRARLQAVYGDGGPGFVPIASPVRYYDHQHFAPRSGRGLTAYRFVHGKLDDGDYGPTGVAFVATPGAEASIDVRDGPSGRCHLRLHYAEAPGGGRVVVRADDREVLARTTDGPVWRHRTASVDVLPCPQRLSTTVSDGPARLYGFELEHDGDDGLVWSTMGVLGARLDQFEHYGVGRLEPALAAMRPDLLVVNFGLNRAAGPWRPPATYPERARGVLERLRAAVPLAACLVVGPYPCGDPKRGLGRVSAGVGAAQRRAASEAGCAFMDRFQLAGGASQILTWRSHRLPMLSGDYTHLTRAGATRMGQAMADVLLATFDGRPVAGTPLSLAPGAADR
ncbi:MAG: GDSL-type esterase/lipase family protein [Myxococcota bacterium]